MDSLYKTELSFCHNSRNKMHMLFCSKLKKIKWVNKSKRGKVKPDFNSLNNWLIKKYNKSLILLNEVELKTALGDFEKEVVREYFIKQILRNT